MPKVLAQFDEAVRPEPRSLADEQAQALEHWLTGGASCSSC
jgi:hypothetical protein